VCVLSLPSSSLPFLLRPLLSLLPLLLPLLLLLPPPPLPLLGKRKREEVTK
jgi:hypothetical protein